MTFFLRPVNLVLLQFVLAHHLGLIAQQIHLISYQVASVSPYTAGLNDPYGSGCVLKQVKLYAILIYACLRLPIKSKGSGKFWSIGG
ncbi:hypothetical protein EK21DRAFT_119739 [Setomelanomma holmii]|uniref:Secreted protein n=1 Tax=Setomelanomma holmii TaxID=210430 RepID=A0A9P4GVF5_9PLEO|nr:hypothetical protein EK21DRAFT_119739 [Setomelanomma holmii]